MLICAFWSQNHWFGLLQAHQVPSICPSWIIHCCISLHYDPGCWTKGGRLLKFFFPKLAILQTANWHVLSLKITVFSYFELLWLQKEAFHLHNFFSRLHDLNLWALGIKHPKEVFFSEPTTLKNADLHFFGLKITILAQYELIRQLVKVPHGITIAYSVFILTLTAGPMGASPSKSLLNHVCPKKN